MTPTTPLPTPRSLRLLQVNFTHHPPDLAAAQQAAWERAHAIAAVPGLCWKIWIYDPDTQMAGGIYLFEDAASAQNYLDGPIFMGLKQTPGVSQMQVIGCQVNVANSAVTRGPLPTAPDHGCLDIAISND